MRSYLEGAHVGSIGCIVRYDDDGVFLVTAVRLYFALPSYQGPPHGKPPPVLDAGKDAPDAAGSIQGNEQRQDAETDKVCGAVLSEEAGRKKVQQRPNDRAFEAPDATDHNDKDAD